MQQGVGGIVTNNIFKPYALAAVQKVKKILSAFRKALFSLSHFLHSSQKPIFFLTLLAFKITKLKYKIFPCHSLDLCYSSSIFSRLKRVKNKTNPNQQTQTNMTLQHSYGCKHMHAYVLTMMRVKNHPLQRNLITMKCVKIQLGDIEG